MHRPAAGEVEFVALVDAVGSRVLTDDEEFLDARGLEVHRLADDGIHRTRIQ